MEPIQRIKRPAIIATGLIVLFGLLTLGGMTVARAARDGGSLTVLSATPKATQVITGTGETSPATTDNSPALLSMPATTATGIPSTIPTSTPPAQPTQAVSSQVSDQAIIKGFPSLAQSYNLSCEYAAAAAVTLYWGNFVSEDVFLNEVPASLNPHLGFRGDINGAFGGITDYGVYAEALVPVLEERGYNAIAFYGGVDRLKANVAAGNPVVVWITTGKYTQRTPLPRPTTAARSSWCPGSTPWSSTVTTTAACTSWT